MKLNQDLSGCVERTKRVVILLAGATAICWGLWLLLGYLGGTWSARDWTVAAFVLPFGAAYLRREWRDNPDGPMRLRGWLTAAFVLSAVAWCVLSTGFAINVYYFSEDSPEMPAWLRRIYFGSKEFFEQYVSLGWMTLILPISMFAAWVCLTLRYEAGGLFLAPRASEDPEVHARAAALYPLAVERLRVVRTWRLIVIIATLWPFVVALPIHFLVLLLRGDRSDEFYDSIKAVGTVATTALGILLEVYRRRRNARLARGAVEREAVARK